MNVENAVLQRYSEGALNRVDSLCCPIEYDKGLLEILPPEIVEKDYGCGDPSKYVREGDHVLDLGSGSGKICYMAAQLVGDNGKVIGIDMNDDMLSLARKYQQEITNKLGNNRVEFIKGYIQDLALDVTALEHWLQNNPVTDVESLNQLDLWKQEQRRKRPLIPDNTIDLVVSNCVLNLVNDDQKRQLISEIFRVVKPGGRVAISDIVSDENIPQHLKEDPLLWSGCISGAFKESEILEIFKETGFQGVCIDKWSAEPWQVIEDIEFRSVTITAVKGSCTECIDKGHAVIYRGPYSYIRDDDNHEYPRGERIAVCERTFRLLTETSCYKDDFIGIIPSAEWQPRTWCAPSGTKRPAAETKGGSHLADQAGSCC